MIVLPRCLVFLRPGKRVSTSSASLSKTVPGTCRRERGSRIPQAIMMSQESLDRFEKGLMNTPDSDTTGQAYLTWEDSHLNQRQDTNKRYR